MSRAAMDHYGRGGLKRSDEHMTRLAALLRGHGIPLTIVVYPWPHQLLWNDRSSLQLTFWKAWAARERADFAELFTAFFREVDARGIDNTVARYFIPGDVHWNADGNGLVAAEFARQFALPPSNGHRGP